MWKPYIKGQKFSCFLLTPNGKNFLNFVSVHLSMEYLQLTANLRERN